MSWFETHLQRTAEDAAVVRIDGLEVSVAAGLEKPVQLAYRSAEQAWCVFEANVEALRDEGYFEYDNRCSDQAPGVLEPFGHTEYDLYRIRWCEDLVEAAHIDVADPAALEDGVLADLRRAGALGRFDQSKLDPVWEVEHALRRLIYHPRTAAMESFSLDITMEHDRILDRVEGSSHRDLLTHLSLHRAWRDGPRCRRRSLSESFPGLVALGLDRWSVPHLGGRPFERLRFVRLSRCHARAGRIPPPTPSIGRSLSQIARLAPKLEALTLHEAATDPEALATLLAHPLSRRLKTLELVATHHRPDLDTLMSARLDLENLEEVFVSDHALNAADRERLDAWPVVCRVGHRQDAPRYRAYRERVDPF
jgi:hypothetical protein